METSEFAKIYDEKFATLQQVDDKILYLVYANNYHLTKAEFEKLLDFYRSYKEKHDLFAVIVEAPSMLSFEMELWEMASTEHYELGLFSAVAVLSNSLQHDLMSKNYHRKNEKVGIPSATFRQFEDALTWCRSLEKA